ncbi:MAG: hypothetical protein M5T52_14120 [Ignavibacteriaceae bacterium]|nr:hypothetical protein [Ignavibacteriaceae bacterium]
MQKEKGAQVAVLCIEDDSANREIVNMYLKDHFDIHSASDSTEALQKIKQKNLKLFYLTLIFARVLMDLN